jgi:hypothetical protein
MPQSPQPASYNETFGLGWPVRPAVEWEGVQMMVASTPVGAKTPDRRLQQVGPPKLQNRRTQSREELNYELEPYLLRA